MASETAKRDLNRETVILGVTNDANLNTSMIRVDPVSLRALMNATITGTPGVYLSTDAINNAGTLITPLFAPIVASASGATTIVAAVSNKQIRVLNYTLMSSGTVNVKFQSHVTPTDLTGLLYLVANTGASPSFSPVGHFQSVVGEALDINLSGAVAVGGHLTYITV